MNLVNDVRYGVRNLRKSPGFALIAITTMALGIGATTAIFSVSDAMLWKPVPVPHLDTRIIGGKKSLLFGPYAGLSSKFLKPGSLTDLF